MNLRLIFLTVLLAFGIVSCEKKEGKEIAVNYDEAKVPEYTLPDLLRTKKGEKIDNFTDWRKLRRQEVLNMFADEVYGEFPSMEYTIDFEEKVLSDSYLNGKATVKEITCEVRTVNGSRSFTILYIFPNEKRDVPVFVGLNFGGNHTIDTLTSISIHKAWVKNSQDKKVTSNTPSEESRGLSASRWPVSTIIDHGYGLASVYYGEIDPDYNDGFENGFHPLFAAAGEDRNKHSSGSISMWAKGMSFIADYLLSDSIADPTRLIAIGHSRLGKTTLWCGANDERFAAVISNNSGCGGAALSRREYGERVARINTVFPHWFCDQFKKYNFKVDKLPVDQHMLLALIAPRPLYVASATDDQWADPRGEFLSLKAAQAVYSLSPGYVESLPDDLPEMNKPVHSKTAYHIRAGKHDITEFDWIMYINWADKYLSE